MQRYLLRQIALKAKTTEIGQTVRLSHVRSVFDRKYSQKRTGEILKIKTRFKWEELLVYTLVDWEGDDIDGSFYESELKAAKVDLSAGYFFQEIFYRDEYEKIS